MIGLLKHNLNLKFHQIIENLKDLDSVNLFNFFLCRHSSISVILMDRIPFSFITPLSITSKIMPKATE